jgi:hypothetical protein
MVLERMLKSEREGDEPILCGLVLRDDQSGKGLVVLYYFNPAGDTTAVQVTANADNVNFVLSQFAATNRLDLATTKAVLFKNEEFLKSTGIAQYYPLESEYFGVPLAKLTMIAAAVVAVGAAATVGYAVTAYTTHSSTQSQLSRALAGHKKLQQDLDEKLLSSVKSFAGTQTVDITAASARANALWVPGAKVVLDSEPGKDTYILSMPLTTGGSTGGAPAILGRLSTSDVAPLLTTTAIPGCTRSAPSISGALNVLQTTITCENSAGLFSAYWPK